LGQVASSARCSFAVAAVGGAPPRPALAAETAAPAPADAAPPAADDSAQQAAHAALVRRVVYQDEAALAALYRDLSPRVYRQALRLARDEGTAEEIVEDVFWQVWRQAPRFDASRGPVVAWVMQMTRSRALDALRARGRNPLHEALDIDDEHSADVHVEHTDPQALLASAQLKAQVEQALCALDPLRRQLVSLAYQGGYSQSEIADQTGLPLGTVKSHLRRALAAMKLSLELTPSNLERPT
jgi:RNA polymerase sigma-70 factor, ECF subfamily